MRNMWRASREETLANLWFGKSDRRQGGRWQAVGGQEACRTGQRRLDRIPPKTC